MEYKVEIDDKMLLIKEHLGDLRASASKLSHISYDLRDYGIDEITKIYGYVMKIAVDTIIMLAVDLDNFFDPPCKKKEE